MNRLLALLLTTLICGAALAGCIDTPASVDPASADDAGAAALIAAPDFDWTTVVDPDHANHQLPALHTGGHGLGVVGHVGMSDIVPASKQASITQVDVWGDYAVVSGMDGGLAFAIIDISEPSEPAALSWWPSAAQGWTARFSDDGQYLFYGCQMLGTPYPEPSLVKGTCEDPEAVHAPGTPAGGVLAFDVSDKAAPQMLDFLPGVAAHNIVVANIAGSDHIFTNGVDIIKFDRDALKLELVANVPGVHDATVSQHPLTGDWLLYTGTGELSIYNINDPSQPEVVYDGAESGGEWTGWHEQTVFPEVLDGRVIMAGGGESFVSPSGVPDTVFFVDITDPSAPALLSSWSVPFETGVPWASYLYSVHEMAAHPDGQLAVSWYHAGVWVLDVSNVARQSEPAVLAAHLPAGIIDVTPSTFAQTATPYVPFVWGAGWKADGHLVVPDMHTGLYLLEPEWGLRAARDSGQ